MTDNPNGIREYRGKRLDTQEWVEGFYFEGPLTHETGEADSYLSGKKRYLIVRDCVTFDVDPKTVSQFTGLLDKNKVKIFGGMTIKAKKSKAYKFQRVDVLGVVGVSMFAWALIDASFSNLSGFTDNSDFVRTITFDSLWEDYEFEVIENTNQ